jgi:rSAM/selenodomain-associated transferase 1
VFGREPVPGRVKTRLAATIGPERAAAVYKALLDHTLRTAASSGGRVILSLAEEPSEHWEGAGAVDHTEVQPAGGLGFRLAEAFRRRFAEGETMVVVVGSDCPAVTADHLTAATDALARVPVVLGPAEDGGYWLVGQRPPGVDLFSEIEWSHPRTLRQTRERLQAIRADWRELECLRDVDDDGDLKAALDDPATPRDLVERLRSILGPS